MQSSAGYPYLIKGSHNAHGATIMETEEIVKRTKANDAAALAMLVEAYSSKARAVCFGITHEDEELRLVMAPSTFNNNIIIPRSTFNIQNFFSLPFFIYISSKKALGGLPPI